MIDHQIEIEKTLTVLKRGGLILYPTDTVWGIGCDATNPGAIDKVYKLKQRAESKTMICLVNDFKMLQQYVEEVPEVAYDILKYATKATTIIYDRPLRVSENIIAEDNTLGIRVVRDPFCGKLIRKLKRPIVSTSANISGKPAPKNFEEISSAILEGVDYVVNLPLQNKGAKPSSIIKIGGDSTVKIIRK
ncbi:threonylcarbamoyl-AMP synthase [Aquimarina sp. AD10]|uniref:L-threonylcarbamoyladenylate synthase n=1 Tax=Aquimarina aggregata TaxID=1642818 RepID=A0A163A3Y1_9FLAO|nr:MULTISPECIES: L-threonylcarbamoyladenylate synthase [Aquimarina]AXT63421.1 threonylcarbamoyl-AMP synthase [Aquimarina sp. AD10]KZS40249.1 translation factor Sua5 [Aquimarina aggregata]RKN00566.1 threonylcarbamoyl-AMP synthase [Aquimarina sp. AD10]